jgi:uncharacterized protein
MNKQIVGAKQIAVFFFFLIFYTVICFLLYTGADHYSLYMMLYMWSPGLAVFTTLAIFRRGISSIWWQWGKTKYVVWCLIIPLLYSAVAYGLIFGAGFAEFDSAKFEKLSTRMDLQGLPLIFTAFTYLLLMGFLGTLSNMASSLGEEIGWRGFLAPALSSKTSFFLNSVIVGLVWAAWHYPLIIHNYSAENNAPLWYLLTFYTIRLILMSFIYGWFTLRSASIWPAIVLHSSHNLFIGVFQSYVVESGTTVWYVGETGAILPLVVLVFAWYFIVKKPRNSSIPVEETGRAL